MAQLLAPLRIERRLAKQPVSEGADVQPRPAHHDRLAASGTRFRNPALRIAGKSPRAVPLSWSHQIQAPMWDSGEGLAIGLRGPDIEPAIHLAGVVRDHGDGGESGERNRDGGFADAGGAHNDGSEGSFGHFTR